MLTNEIYLEEEPTFDFDILAPKERIIFFDIETTGLKADYAMIYLIGAVYFEDGRWKLTQYFAEGTQEETKVLAAFFGLIQERRRLGRLFLISFNGDGFDIPFIMNRVRLHRLNFDLSSTFSLDLYKHIKPYKKLAGLENCKLKTVEKLCGIYREDRYGGGELIDVYWEYLRLAGLDEDSCEYNEQNLKLRDVMLKTLLLHNAEDIMDMPFVMDILGYDSLFAEEAYEVTESVIADGVWNIEARLRTPLPKGIYSEDGNMTVSISEEEKLRLNIAVNVYEGELKSFYTDYKSYYYLPGEDYAIHKSLGEFVDKKQRRQATAKTCYQRVEGVFIPEPEPVFAPVFYKEYKQQPGYGRVDAANEDIFSTIDNKVNVDFAQTKKYIKAVLSSLK